MQRTTVILLLIALLLPSVSAQDFLAFGDTTVNTIPCGTAIRNVTIQNTQNNQATYTLSVDGDASDYVTFSMLSFVLNPGQAAKIQTFYTIPCTLRPGTYATDIYFTDGEVEKILTQDVIVAVPDNINVAVAQTSAVIAPCETAGYTFDLHNPLNFTEIYTIEADGHPQVHVSEKIAVMQGDEHKSIMVSVTPDDCTQSGTFPLTVKISTEKSAQQKELPFELIIKSTDIPVLAEGVSKIRTDYVDSTADLTIENTGDRTTQYTLSIEGISWASIAPETVTLSPGQSKTLALRLTPSEEIPRGRYPITLYATVETTGIRYGKDLNVVLKPQTAFERNPTLVIVIIVVVLAALVGLFYLSRYTKSPEFKAKMQRRREQREAARKAKEQRKAERFRRKLEQQRKDIERRQAERERLSKQLQRKLERDLKKEYHLVARKDIVAGTRKGHPLRIAALVLGVLVLLLIVAAWSLIAPNAPYVVVGIIILFVIFLAKKLSRNRVIRAKWKMLIEQQTVTLAGWKKGLSLLSITAEKPLKQFKLLVRKTRSKHTPSTAVYNTFALKTNAPDGSASFRATFTVSKRWLAGKNIDAGDVKLARYTNQSWSTIPLKKTGEGKKFIHFTAEFDKTGTYSIYGKPKPKSAGPVRKIIWGIIGVALIIAIALVLSPQQEDTIAHGIPPQVWKQDMVHHVELSTYFKDPDNDTLTFEATEVKHVIIEIQGSTAFLTPDDGWTGEERVRFVATDGKGGKVASNIVPLRVQKQIIPQHLQPYIATVLAILAIILLIWTVRSQQKR